MVQTELQVTRKLRQPISHAANRDAANRDAGLVADVPSEVVDAFGASTAGPMACLWVSCRRLRRRG
mgnify:CR=1 FL=1